LLWESRKNFSKPQQKDNFLGLSSFLSPIHRKTQRLAVHDTALIVAFATTRSLVSSYRVTRVFVLEFHSPTSQKPFRGRLLPTMELPPELIQEILSFVDNCTLLTVYVLGSHENSEIFWFPLTLLLDGYPDS
jgi:hypothetical protein